MNNAIIIQCATPSYDGIKMMELTKERNEEYCKKHDFDFEYLVGDVLGRNIMLGGWDRIELIRRAMEKGYDYIVWLDADALIYDVDVDLREACQNNKIGACWHRIPQLNHWNTGVLYIHNTTETYKFICDWLESYPPPSDGWMEQGVFNRMAMKSRNVVTISDKWNATIDVSMVPDAVVLGFHGQGDSKNRYEMMNQTIAKQKARSDSGIVE